MELRGNIVTDEGAEDAAAAGNEEFSPEEVATSRDLCYGLGYCAIRYAISGRSVAL